MKICKTTGALYVPIESTLWLINLSLATGAHVDDLPLDLLIGLGTLKPGLLN